MKFSTLLFSLLLVDASARERELRKGKNGGSNGGSSSGKGKGKGNQAAMSSWTLPATAAPGFATLRDIVLDPEAYDCVLDGSTFGARDCINGLVGYAIATVAGCESSDALLCCPRAAVDPTSLLSAGCTSLMDDSEDCPMAGLALEIGANADEVTQAICCSSGTLINSPLQAEC